MQDNQRLTRASMHGTINVPVYDDGFGPLWILRNSMGVQGIIRAQTWEDAYSIAEDEMFPDCDLTMEEIVKEYGFRVEYAQPYGHGQTSREETIDPEAWSENELFLEAYGFRPNGMRDSNVPMSYIYSKDLNGDYLDTLTPELIEELSISLNIETESE